MTPTERYVVLGLAHPRALWFRSVAQWSTAGTLPVEFLKCLSVAELRSRLASGRPFSAIVIDATLSALDCDLVDVAVDAGCAVLAVGGRERDLEALGVAASLRPDMEPGELLDALVATAHMVGRGADVPGPELDEPLVPWRGDVALVCGPGGTGTSTVAIGLAQGLASDVRLSRSVLLADLALHAEQAMLHDAGDVVPSVQELVDAHRSGRPSAEEVRALTFEVEERGYRLLLGLRRARAWAVLRPRAFEAAFDSLRRTHRVVVCDADGDLEGEVEGGSIDVEERHVMARTAASDAAVAFVVGTPGVKGLHALNRTVSELLTFGVPAGRVVPVINRAPRSPRARAQLTAALAGLLPNQHDATSSAVFLPDRRIEQLVVDGRRLPDAFTAPLAAAFAAVLSQQRPTHRRSGQPQPVRPGSLGTAGRPESPAADGEDEAVAG